MPEDTTSAAGALETTAPAPGPVSTWLSSQGFEHTFMPADHLGVEVLAVEPAVLPLVATALRACGFDYLQCQGGYDEGPGGQLVSFYHLVKMAPLAASLEAGSLAPGDRPEEVRLKVFLPRDGALTVPSLYGLFRGADWQERAAMAAEALDSGAARGLLERGGRGHDRRLGSTARARSGVCVSFVLGIDPAGIAKRRRRAGALAAKAAHEARKAAAAQEVGQAHQHAPVDREDAGEQRNAGGEADQREPENHPAFGAFPEPRGDRPDRARADQPGQSARLRGQRSARPVEHQRKHGGDQRHRKQQ